ncbi:MAG: hypothetical protein ACPG2Y_03195 [Acholeplasmataceae bacterium]
MRGETWHDAKYNQQVISWNYPENIFQFRLELRGQNAQRSAMHVWIDREVTMWYDHEKSAPNGYHIYMYCERDFLTRYYSPACAAKIPHHFGTPIDENTNQGPETVQKSAKRKIQCFPFMAGIIQYAYWAWNGFDCLQTRIVRYLAAIKGPLYMPVHVIRQLTMLLELHNCCHRDLTYINYQRACAAMWGIIINIKSGKINWLTGKIDEKKQWKLKPAVLDAHTYRNGMRNQKGE